jgi:ATPase subunit of ABC transporter with duplicated ATPase domains
VGLAITAPVPTVPVDEGKGMGGMRQVLELGRVRKPYGDKTVLGVVTLAFAAGAKVGVVGPNGIGKSTLLRLLVGLGSATASSPAARRR